MPTLAPQSRDCVDSNLKPSAAQMELPRTASRRERYERCRLARRAACLATVEVMLTGWLAEVDARTAMELRPLRSIYAAAFEAMDRRLVRLEDLRRTAATVEARSVADPSSRCIFLPGIYEERQRWLYSRSYVDPQSAYISACISVSDERLLPLQKTAPSAPDAVCNIH